jgi:hypothetical protein
MSMSFKKHFYKFFLITYIVVLLLCIILAIQDLLLRIDVNNFTFVSNCLGAFFIVLILCIIITFYKKEISFKRIHAILLLISVGFTLLFVIFLPFLQYTIFSDPDCQRNLLYADINRRDFPLNYTKKYEENGVQVYKSINLDERLVLELENIPLLHIEKFREPTSVGIDKVFCAAIPDKPVNVKILWSENNIQSIVGTFTLNKRFGVSGYPRYIFRMEDLLSKNTITEANLGFTPDSYKLEFFLNSFEDNKNTVKKYQFMSTDKGQTWQKVI